MIAVVEVGHGVAEAVGVERPGKRHAEGLRQRAVHVLGQEEIGVLRAVGGHAIGHHRTHQRRARQA